MENKTTEWMSGPVPTVCRCCLAEGCYKDISTEYFWMGKREVYAEMLSETFDLSIAYAQSGGPNSHSRLICEPCISRLRDASEFKKQVQECEKTFMNHLDPCSTTVTVEIEPSDKVKLETVKEEQKQSDSEDFEDRLGFEDDDDDDLDDQPLTKLASKPLKKEKADLLDLLDNSQITVKRKSTLKAKAPPAKKAKLKIKEKAKPSPSKAPTKTPKKKKESLSNSKYKLWEDDEANTKLTGRRTSNRRKYEKNAESTDKNNFNATTEQQWLKISERRGNGPLLRANSLKLLEHSTLCVFQWHKSRYRCYCCKEPFFNMDALREHTFNVHALKDIEKIIIMQQNLLVKVEISKLFCKICQNRVKDLKALRQHLTESHQVGFVSNEDLLVPFKIGGNELQCQICFERFTAFRLLNVHMNKHYQKQVCSICGAGFSNLKFLNLHKVRQHRPLKCKPCGLTFQSRADKKHHDANVHGVKIERKLRFPCPYCDVRFLEESYRVRHLVDEHGLEKPEHKCSLCSKVFITKSLFNSHMKSIHMKEKNQECDVCHKFFYSKSDVSRHRVTHTGEKNYSCSLCNILYATKDSLRRHRKRAHVGQ